MLMELRFRHRQPDICTSVISTRDTGLPTSQ